MLALVVSAWLGAAVLLSASVAPAAFAVLPSRTLAGALVGRILQSVFIAGLILGVLAAIVEPTWRRAAGATMAACCAIAQFVVTPQIERLRADRVAFGRLHGVSVALLGVAMLAALAIIWRSYDSR